MGQHWYPDSDEERMIGKAVKQGIDYSQKMRQTFTPPPQQTPSMPSEPSYALNETFLPIRPPPPAHTKRHSEQSQEVVFTESVQWEGDSRAPLQSRENTPLSPTMAENSNAAAKGRKSSVGTDPDSLMPLLLASLGNPTISFRIMATMDEEGRTQSALEHKFRNWRKIAREITEKHPDIAGPATTPTAKKTRAAPAKHSVSDKAKGKQADVGDEEDENGEEGGSGTVKKEENESGATESETTPLLVKGKTPKTKKGTSNNGSKKRGSQDADAEADNEQTPAKKTKVTKKGTAKVVKKPAAKGREVEVTDEEGESGEDANKGAITKAKGRAKAVSKKKPKTDDEKKPQTPEWIEAPTCLEDYQDAYDAELGASEEDEMTDMQFEA